MDASTQAAIYVSNVVGQQIVGWYLPSHYPATLHITVPDRHDALQNKDIRFCNVRTVTLDGLVMPWAELLSLYGHQWFNPSTTIACTIGKVSAMSFQFQFTTHRGRHFSGSGDVAMRLTLDPARQHTLSIRVQGAHSFIKLM